MTNTSRTYRIEYIRSEKPWRQWSCRLQIGIGDVPLDLPFLFLNSIGVYSEAIGVYSVGSNKQEAFDKGASLIEEALALEAKQSKSFLYRFFSK